MVYKTIRDKFEKVSRRSIDFGLYNRDVYRLAIESFDLFDLFLPPALLCLYRYRLFMTRKIVRTHGQNRFKTQDGRRSSVEIESIVHSRVKYHHACE